jgi:hypothetical protein
MARSPHRAHCAIASYKGWVAGWVAIALSGCARRDSWSWSASVASHKGRWVCGRVSGCDETCRRQRRDLVPRPTPKAGHGKGSGRDCRSCASAWRIVRRVALTPVHAARCPRCPRTTRRDADGGQVRWPRPCPPEYPFVGTAKGVARTHSQRHTSWRAVPVHRSGHLREDARSKRGAGCVPRRGYGSRSHWPSTLAPSDRRRSPHIWRSPAARPPASPGRRGRR